MLDDEDPHAIQESSEVAGTDNDYPASSSSESEILPKAALFAPSKTESEMSEDDLPRATGNGLNTATK